LSGETTDTVEVTDGRGDGGAGDGDGNSTGNEAGFADGVFPVEESGADS
jgi:hypothetical protein